MGCIKANDVRRTTEVIPPLYSAVVSAVPTTEFPSMRYMGTLERAQERATKVKGLERPPVRKC